LDQVRNRVDRKVYAMKVISKKVLRRKNSVENMRAERDILTKVDHPFVVGLRCSFSTEKKLFLVMDFHVGGELFFHLRKAGLLLEATARFYVAEILLALEHLHSSGIIHRDLKPENVLMSVDGHAVLTDFGLAKDFTVKRHARTHTVMIVSV
jgi:p70 ribosomal S6 kinase